jgi:hypothetical protein
MAILRGSDNNLYSGGAIASDPSTLIFVKFSSSVKDIFSIFESLGTGNEVSGLGVSITAFWVAHPVVIKSKKRTPKVIFRI